MADESLPPGYEKNTPEQMQLLNDLTLKAWQQFEGKVAAMGVVIVTRDRRIVMSGFAGDLDDPGSIGALFQNGPDNLRVTIKRALDGKGLTHIIGLKEE
jgi:hypothetical protein